MVDSHEAISKTLKTQGQGIEIGGWIMNTLNVRHNRAAGEKL